MGFLSRDSVMLLASFSSLFYVVETYWIIGQQALDPVRWSLTWYVPIILSLFLTPSSDTQAIY